MKNHTPGNLPAQLCERTIIESNCSNTLTAEETNTPDENVMAYDRMVETLTGTTNEKRSKRRQRAIKFPLKVSQTRTLSGSESVISHEVPSNSRL